MDTQDLDVVRTYYPHLQRVGQLALARGLSIEASLLDALDAMKAAALLVDHDRHVLHITDRARRPRPSVLKSRGERLRPLDTSAVAEFDRMLAQAVPLTATTDPKFISLIALRRTVGCPVLVQALPLRGAANDLFHRARAAAFRAESTEGSGQIATVTSMVSYLRRA